jgi:hypothetical protein
VAKKLAIYTALFGKFEPLYDPLGHLDGTYYDSIDRFYFTDLDMSDKRISYPIIPKHIDHLPSVRRQRRTKILIPEEIYDNYEFSIWVDSRPKLAADPYSLIDYMEPDSDMMLMRHNDRDCVYDEGRVCVDNGKAIEKEVSNQLDFYRDIGYPPHNGLWATNMMLRRHTGTLLKLMRIWWSQIEAFSHRDQISLPYAARVAKAKISSYPDELRGDLFLQGLVLTPSEASVIQWS